MGRLDSGEKGYRDLELKLRGYGAKLEAIDNMARFGTANLYPRQLWEIATACLGVAVGALRAIETASFVTHTEELRNVYWADFGNPDYLDGFTEAANILTNEKLQNQYSLENIFQIQRNIYRYSEVEEVEDSDLLELIEICTQLDLVVVRPSLEVLNAAIFPEVLSSKNADEHSNLKEYEYGIHAVADLLCWGYESIDELPPSAACYEDLITLIARARASSGTEALTGWCGWDHQSDGNKNDFREQARVIVQTLIAAGLWIVPQEPTDAMLAATEVDQQEARKLWESMLGMNPLRKNE